MAADGVNIPVSADVAKYIRNMERALESTKRLGKSAGSVKDEFISSIPVIGQMTTAAGAFGLAWQGVSKVISLVRAELDRAKGATNDIGVGLRGVVASLGLSKSNAAIQEMVTRQASAPGSLIDVKEGTAAINAFGSTATNATESQIGDVLTQAQNIERSGMDSNTRNLILQASGALIESSNIRGGSVSVERAVELATVVIQEGGGATSPAIETYRFGVMSLGYQYAEELAALTIAASKGGSTSFAFLKSAIGEFATRGARGSLIEFVRRFAVRQRGENRLSANVVSSAVSTGLSAVAGSRGILGSMALDATVTDRFAMAAEAQRVSVEAGALTDSAMRVASTLGTIGSSISATTQQSIQGVLGGDAPGMTGDKILSRLFMNMYLMGNSAQNVIEANTGAIGRMSREVHISNSRVNPREGDER